MIVLHLGIHKKRKDALKRQTTKYIQKGGVLSMRKLLLGIMVGLMLVSCAFATENQPTVTLVAKKSKAKRKTTPQRKPVTNQHQ